MADRGVALDRILRDAVVTSVRFEIIGDGEGFIGQIARYPLELDRPEPNAPHTLIAKLLTQIALNRTLGEMLGAYEREIRFYQELAVNIELVSPRHDYSAMDPNPLTGREENAIRFVNWIPVWLMRWLIPVFLLHRLIAGSGLFDLSGERGEKILDRIFEGILATRPDRNLDALLAEATSG